MGKLIFHVVMTLLRQLGGRGGAWQPAHNVAGVGGGERSEAQVHLGHAWQADSGGHLVEIQTLFTVAVSYFMTMGDKAAQYMV
jgi:hypothetical protein